MPAMAAGDVENAPAEPDQGGPATHPGRGRIDFMRLRGHGANYLAAQALAYPPRLVQHSEGISPWRSGHGTQHSGDQVSRRIRRPAFRAAGRARGTSARLRLVRPLLHLL